MRPNSGLRGLFSLRKMKQQLGLWLIRLGSRMAGNHQEPAVTITYNVHTNVADVAEKVRYELLKMQHRNGATAGLFH